MNLETTLQKRYKTQKEAKHAFVASLNKARIDHAGKVDAFVVAVAMAEAFDIVKMPNPNNRLESFLYIWNPTQQYHTDLRFEISRHCTNAISILNLRSDEENLCHKVMRFLKSGGDEFERVVDNFRMPPNHYILLKDGPFDCKSDEYISDNEAAQFHFTYRSPFSRKTKLDEMYLQIGKRALLDWANEDQDTYQFLLDYMRCVIEGNNKGKALIIVGPGGNGKSSYITICCALLEKQSVFNLNMHEAENSFALEGLTSDTRIIAGDDLRTNYRLGGDSLARYKSIVDNRPVKINPKGQRTYDVQTHCCVIQASNTMPKFAESNDATRARFILLEWAAKNFREMKQNSEFEFDIDELSRNVEFLETIFNLVLNETQYFEHLRVPKSISDKSNSTIDANDNVKVFVDLLENEGYLTAASHLPVTAIKACYDAWLKSENPSAATMSGRVFSDRFVSHMRQLGFELEIDQSKNIPVRKRISSFSNIEFNTSIIEDFLGVKLSDLKNKPGFTGKSIVLVNKSNQMKQSEIDEIAELIRSGKADINDESHIRVLKHLIYDLHEAVIASQYQMILDDL